jgi:hypothetical protein
MKNKIFLIGILSLNLMTTANASSNCPTQHASAICINGLWQVMIDNTKNWTRYSPDIVNKACMNKDEQTDKIRWNYAAQAHNSSSIYCSYTLFDSQNFEIGLINIESNLSYSRTGDNWKPGDFPGDWECYTGRVDCRFTPL